jgi:hypothetical protein
MRAAAARRSSLPRRSGNSGLLTRHRVQLLVPHDVVRLADLCGCTQVAKHQLVAKLERVGHTVVLGPAASHPDLQLMTAAPSAGPPRRNRLRRFSSL